MEDYFSVRWVDGKVIMLDQRLLPEKLVYREYSTCEEVATAIQQMVIRGAPAIGIAAGFGLALSAYDNKAIKFAAFYEVMKDSANILRKSRPTAVNLFGAVDRIMHLVEYQSNSDLDSVKHIILREALRIEEEDVLMNKKIGMNGQQFIPENANVIHHCNTGGLATGGYGTALGVIRTAHEMGKNIHVYVDETRPRLQGARLTSWELKQLNIPHTIIVDGASGFIMKNKKIHACLVGCDRIASNGDVANKIGTYNLALVAKEHMVPFYSVGPTTTIDLSIASGKDITIEERSEREITHIGDTQITPDGVRVANPSFDITPAKFITAIITNDGVAYPPYENSLASLLKEG